MSNSVTGIPTSRVTENFVRNQILRQSQASQFALSRLEEQLSSGYRFQTPSDDPIAAMQVVGLQRLLQRKAQVKTNLETTQSYLGATDTALSNVFSLITTARSTAVGIANAATTTDTQRQTAVVQIQQTINQLLNTGNQQFRGRYLFSGTESQVAPFFANSSGMIQYLGNDQHLMSYSDINLLTSTNVTGNEAFGAISAEVKGSATIVPDLTYDTRLADLRQGQGISRGSILIADGTTLPDGTPNEVTIDLSGAKTIGDVAALIGANPPQGRQLYVDITNKNLTVSIDSAPGVNLIIREVGSGTVAEELGIRNETGTKVVGRPLEPVLRNTTKLDDLFGSYATAVVHSAGTDNDVRIKAGAIGAELNNVAIVFQGDAAVTPGTEFVDAITPGPNAQLIVHVALNGMSRAYQVVNAINTAHTADPISVPFTADIDPLDDVNGGLGPVQLGASANTGDSGSGEAFDKEHGLQIVNNGRTQTIDFSTAITVADVLNILNGSGTGVIAEINQSRNGINLLSGVSGCDFEVGENGGKTASQFGIRSMTESTALGELNYGRGVGVAKNSMPIMAEAAISSTANNGSLTIRAKASDGDPQANYWNDFEVLLSDTGDNPPTVVYDQAARTLTVGVRAGTTTANDVIAAVNTSAAATDFVAASAYNDNGTKSDGSGLVTAGMTATSGGTPLDNDFTITRSDGAILYLDISGARTVNDVINAINNDPKNVVLPPTPRNPHPDRLYAQLSKYGNGIELVDRSGGTGDIVVTKNPFSSAAVDLGLVPQNKTTSNPGVPDHSATVISLGDAQSGILIHGRNASAPIDGVKVVLDSTAHGVVFNQNTRTLTVGYTAGDTANDVIAAINASPAATLFEAERAPIPNNGTGAIVNWGPVTMAGGSATNQAEGVADIPGVNNDLSFTAKSAGSAYNNVQIQLVGAAGAPISFARAGNLITITYDSTAGADANQIVAAWDVAGNWPPGDTTRDNVAIALDPADGPPNFGLAPVADGTATFSPMTTGERVLSGADVNPQETQGIFTALLRMRDAIMRNDLQGLERSVNVLDEATTSLNYTRAELGAREQSVQMVQEHVVTENIELQTALSQNHDVDFVQVVSDLTARQTAYQASLMSLGKIMQMSLLNYL
jgi:flagellin-like hook-associated protein FlgL